MSSEESPAFGNDDEPIIKSVGESGDNRTSPDEIDWSALWEEFGFDSTDATGNYVISRTQLVPAIETSEQTIAGDPGAIIEDAVRDGPLETNHVADEYGSNHLRGYLFPEVAE